MASNLMSSISSLLGSMCAAGGDGATNRLEEIRQAMLECVGTSGSPNLQLLERRIRLAGDVQGLWYLRGDLMVALSAMQGESAARKKIQKLTSLFDGMLPPGLCSRSSPLGSERRRVQR